MKRLFFMAICIFLVSIICFCLYRLTPEVADSVQSAQEKKHVEMIVEETTRDNERFSRQSFEELYAVNNDLAAYLSFESGLVSVPVVQGYDNEQYLRQSFEKQYSTQGVPFMDADASLDSTHFVIFGHNVYYDDSAMFSPLAGLCSQDSYAQNRVFDLYTADEVRSYVITNVYYFTDDDSLAYDYMQKEFSDEASFNSWISIPNARNLIDSGSDCIQYGDSFVTLQTCKRWDDHAVILILAREISRHPY